MSDLTGNGTPAEVAIAILDSPIPEPEVRNERYTFVVQGGGQVLIPTITRGTVEVTVAKGVDYTDIAGRHGGVADGPGIEFNFADAQVASRLKPEEKKDADKLFGGLKGSQSDGTITG